MPDDAPTAGPPDQSDLGIVDTAVADEVGRMAAAVRRAERRVCVLQELTDIGMDLTRVLHEQVLTKATAPDKGGDKTAPADEDPRPAADPADTFAKLSRAIRLTVDLEGRADEALRALLTGETVARKARHEAGRRSAAAAAEARETDARARVETQVGLAIAREAESESEHHDLRDALEERLAEDGAYDTLAERPLREVVEQLCGDLGLTPDWSGWAEPDGWSDPLDAPPYRSRWSVFSRISRTTILDGTDPP